MATETTSSGGEGEPSQFLTTRWTLVFEAASDNDSTALEALGELAGAYWQPLYRYARRKGKSREDAEDLVQGFLSYLLSRDGSLDHVDRSRGRFRTFLLASFNHWMINDWKKATRLKRGGTSRPLSLDLESAETGLKLDPADDRSPDRHFDREWALALLDKVLADLECAATNEGSGKAFAVLKGCLTVDSEKIPFRELAGRLGVSEGAARVAVHRLRKRYRTALEAEVERTLDANGSVEDELHSLFAALSNS
jgi:RNA polymerase sigma-70 factor (ECF subfamily)